MGPFTPHKFSYCDHCERQVVLCGSCGNNTCNGGYGEVMSSVPGEMMKCPDCPSAYDLDQSQYEKKVANSSK
jgi:hypothetical protein